MGMIFGGPSNRMHGQSGGEPAPTFRKKDPADPRHHQDPSNPRKPFM